MSGEFLLPTAAYLATRPNSMRIELQHAYSLPPHMENYQEATVRSLRDYSSQEIMSTRQELESAYAHGLFGEDMLIGLSDTGIDVNSCFFYDPDHPVRFNSEEEDTKHRKIALYIPFSNNKEDGSEAHGTHVAGTLAGMVEGDNDLSPYDGIAYKSRIVFFDIGSGSGQETTLKTPRRITYLIDAIYSAGANVHSASWGSFSEVYSFDTSSIDNYVYPLAKRIIIIVGMNIPIVFSCLLQETTGKRGSQLRFSLSV